jgi:nucleotide-binding universal stress UspA family protein
MRQMDTGLRYRVKRAARQIASQHRHIRSTVDAIREAAAGGAAQDLRTALVGLQNAVDAHFSLEEDVFFPAIHGLHPEYAGVMEALGREHVRFVSELRRIAEGLELSDLARFASAFEAFANSLAAHEVREEELVGVMTDALREEQREVVMTRIRTILVPVDFSAHSAEALEYAIDLAKVFGAAIHLLHCYQINVGGVSPYGLVIPEDFDREVRAAAEQKLSEWGEKARAQGITVEERISPMFPAATLADTAKEISADLIVMGTRGLTGLRHVLLGSVAERTLRVAPCPVLTVKVPRDE